MITRDQVAEALTFIAETDASFAESKTEVERSQWLCKHVRAISYELTSGTVDERKAAVERSQDVSRAEDRRIAAVLAFEEVKAKRETKALLIEVWRTVESSRRAGVL